MEENTAVEKFINAVNKKRDLKISSKELGDLLDISPGGTSNLIRRWVVNGRAYFTGEIGKSRSADEYIIPINSLLEEDYYRTRLEKLIEDSSQAGTVKPKNNCIRKINCGENSETRNNKTKKRISLDVYSGRNYQDVDNNVLEKERIEEEKPGAEQEIKFLKNSGDFYGTIAICKDENEKRARIIAYLRRAKSDGKIPFYELEEEGRFVIVSGFVPYEERGMVDGKIVDDERGIVKIIDRTTYFRAVARAIQTREFYINNLFNIDPSDPESGFVAKLEDLEKTLIALKKQKVH